MTKFEKININKIKPAPYNPRIMPPEEAEKLKKGLTTFGLVDPIIIDLTDHNTVIGGHQRLEALTELGVEELNLLRLGDIGLLFNETKLRIKDKNDQKALNLALNKIQGEWDYNKLDDLLLELNEEQYQIELTGFTEEDIELGFDEQTLEQIVQDEFNQDVPPELNEDKNQASHSPKGELINNFYGTEQGGLARDFIVPPFSTVSSRKGEWQKRKKSWNNLIQDNGETRKNLLSDQMGVSITDPVLSEIMIKWFTPTETPSNICDPFSGDSVIGYVSSSLGNKFTGIELRPEQVDLNNNRLKSLNTDSKYICDDGQNILKYISPNTQDFIISCPPYYDLEVYSNLKNDASNQETYQDFYKIIDTAFTNTITTLKDNRFAVIICSDIRDKKGFFHDFPGDIIQTFKKSGMGLYNRISLENIVGSAAIRVRKQFKYRKVVKLHQNVLIFYKGNPKKIPDYFKEIRMEKIEYD